MSRQERIIARISATTRRAVLVLVLLAGPHPASARPARAGAGPPPDVAAYLKRHSDCRHWSGEDAYDAARDRQIADAVTTLRCGALAADAVRLRRRHRGDPAVLTHLDRARDDG